jgi:hypothetical protein
MWRHFDTKQKPNQKTIFLRLEAGIFFDLRTSPFCHKTFVKVGL